MLDKKQLGKRIRQALKEARLTFKAAAIAFDISDKAVSGWCRTGKIEKGKLPKLATMTGKPLAYFMPDADALPPITVSDGETPPSYVRLPQYEAEASAGNGTVIDESGVEVVRYLDVARWWARQNLPRDTDRVKVLSVRGDSMAPDMQDGDVLFVDTAITVCDAAGIYVLSWNGRALVKRLSPKAHGGGLVISSANKAYEPEFVPLGELDQLHIGGRVVAWWTLRKY